MKKFILSIIVLSTAFIGCSTDLDINKDPDSLDPSKAALSTQLPAGISGLAASEGSTLAIIGGFWSQFWTQSNASNQFKDIDGYTNGTADYNWAWDGMYDALGDIRNIKRKALAEGNWNYYLIATTLEVQGSQILTDFYGSIPYNEANNQTILQPKFNTGEEVYDYMIDGLTDALSKDLSQSVGETPSKDDFVFRGDMEKWTQFANTLKLKVYMRQTNSSRASIANAGITALLNSGVEFLNEDAGMINDVDGKPIYTNAINQSNPLYEYNNRGLNTSSNLRMSTTLSSFLIENSDNRRDAYYLEGNGLNQGDFSSTANPNSIAIVNNSATAPVLFMSKEESLFLQAEAAERSNGGVGAKEFYEAAVEANFVRFGLAVGDLLTGAYAYPTDGTFEEKLEAIITQKWIASFPCNGFESFFEKNRTGYPKTSDVSQSDEDYVPGQFAYSENGATGGLFPQRIVYPLTERNANSKAPALEKITTPIWWAKN